MRLPSFLTLLLLAACTVEPILPRPALAVPDPLNLPAVFDCLRSNRLALVSAHRGQAEPSRAENALSSLRETAAAGPLLLEVDVARTADGVLVLMHDDTLDRTTSGRGPVAGRTVTSLRRLQLRTPDGRLLGEPVPVLADVLRWARREGAMLKLDMKRGVSRTDVVQAVRAARMESQVVLIAYDLAGTRELLALAPEMMVSASGANAAEWRTLLQMAQSNPRLLGFTGTREPDAALIAGMNAVGMEAITGTLGRPGERLDDHFMADGDGREYADLAARGVAVIASDRPIDAWYALKAAGRDGTRCLDPQADEEMR